jgi:hypothetical protein
MTLEDEAESNHLLKGALQDADWSRRLLMRNATKADWIKRMNLTINEVNCVIAYTGYIYGTFDIVTRNHKVESSNFTVYYYTLMNAVSKISKASNSESIPFTVYRGISRRINVSSEAIYFPSFSSSSLSHQVADNFMGFCKCQSCLLTVNTTVGAPIYMISDVPSEREVLLPPTIQFSVIYDNLDGENCMKLIENADKSPNITHLPTDKPTSPSSTSEGTGETTREPTTQVIASSITSSQSSQPASPSTEQYNLSTTKSTTATPWSKSSTRKSSSSTEPTRISQTTITSTSSSTTLWTTSGSITKTADFFFGFSVFFITFMTTLLAVR